MQYFRRYNKLIILLIFPALCLLFYNNTANWHQHQLDNGNIASHAHPFSKQTDNPTPFQKHKHSKSEFLILDKIIQFFLILVTGLFIYKTLLSSIHSHQKVVLLYYPFQSHLFTNRYRGPPSA